MEQLTPKLLPLIAERVKLDSVLLTALLKTEIMITMELKTVFNKYLLLLDPPQFLVRVLLILRLLLLVVRYVEEQTNVLQLLLGISFQQQN